MLYESRKMLYENEKYHLSILFLRFRIIRQILQKKYDTMSLVKQKINPSIDKRDFLERLGGIRWIFLLHIRIELQMHTITLLRVNWVHFSYIQQFHLKHFTA